MLIRWIFRRGTHLLTCQLTRQVNGREYNVSLVPHWDRAHEGTDTFGSAISALHRHAAIATTLRESGWTLVAYSRQRPLPPDCGALDRRAA